MLFIKRNIKHFQQSTTELIIDAFKSITNSPRNMALPQQSLVNVEYYIHNNQKYIKSFPTTLFPLKPLTGPEMCPNCQEYGTIDEVFVGFCANCHDYEYENQFGSETDVNAEAQLEVHYFPEAFVPNYITDAEYNAISDIFTDTINRLTKKDTENDDNSGPFAFSDTDGHYVLCRCEEKVYIKDLPQEEWDDAYYYNTALCPACRRISFENKEYEDYGPETELNKILNGIRQTSMKSETKEEKEEKDQDQDQEEELPDVHCFCGFNKPMLNNQGDYIYAKYGPVPICECMRDAYNRPYRPNYIDEEPIWFP